MGKKKYDQYMEQLLAAIRQAQQPSQFEQQATTEWNNIGNWLNAKDYRNMPAGVNVDLLPIAEYQKMRQMMRGRDDGGQGAKGANTNMLAQQQKTLSDDMFTRGWGGQYEQAVGGLQDRRDALANGLQSAHTGRMGVGIQGAQSMLQAYQSRPKSFWSSLLPSMISGGAQIGAAFI